MSSTWRRQKQKKKHSRVDHSIQDQHVTSDFEKALEEQRKKHQKQSEEENVCEKKEIPKATLPGFVYDVATDRYYRKTHAPPILRQRINNDVNLKQGNVHSQKNQVGSNNVFHLLYKRESNDRSNAYLYSTMGARSISMEALQNEIFSDSSIDYHSDTDISYHFLFGVARASAHSICIYNENGVINDTVNLRSFTRLGASSDPHWRPQTSTQRPTLAALVRSPTFVQTVLLQCNNENSINSNHTNNSNHNNNNNVRELWDSREGNRWTLNKIGGVGSKDQGSVRGIGWDNTGDNLFMLCETGVWMNNIEKSAVIPSSSNVNRNISLNSFDRSTMILSTASSDKNKYSQAIAICNTNCNESIKFIGFRNGELLSIDLRDRKGNMNIGKLPYCTDHVQCLNDEITLVAQDITGQISLYDCRMAGRAKDMEYSRIVNGSKEEVRKSRRFWLSGDESFIYAPANTTYRKSNIAGIAAYSLRRNTTIDLIDEFEKNSNFLSYAQLQIPTKRDNGTAMNELSAVNSSVKIATCSHSNLDIGHSNSNSCSGLYCVANVCESVVASTGVSTSSRARGSILFKGNNSIPSRLK